MGRLAEEYTDEGIVSWSSVAMAIGMSRSWLFPWRWHTDGEPTEPPCGYLESNKLIAESRETFCVASALCFLHKITLYKVTLESLGIF